MSNQLLPCPFCGGDANAKPHSQHLPGCYFDAMAALKAAPKGDLSMAPEVVRAWNRRSTRPASGEPVAKYRERSNHHVIRQDESLPCYCWAESDHRIGQEVAAPPAAAPVAAGEPVATVSRFFVSAWNDGSGQGGGWRYELKVLGDLPVGKSNLYATPPAAAHGHVPSVSGIGRDAGHPRALVLYLRSEPTDDDVRAIQESLRGNAAAHGDEAVRKDAARYQWLRKKSNGLALVLVANHCVNELDAEIDAAMRAQGDWEVQ